MTHTTDMEVNEVGAFVKEEEVILQPSTVDELSVMSQSEATRVCQ